MLLLIEIFFTFVDFKLGRYLHRSEYAVQNDGSLMPVRYTTLYAYISYSRAYYVVTLLHRYSESIAMQYVFLITGGCLQSLFHIINILLRVQCGKLTSSLVPRYFKIPLERPGNEASLSSISMIYNMMCT